MKPLVVADVADATGLMEATFFNQPWLSAATRPGRGSCSRQVPGPQPLPRRHAPAPTRGAWPPSGTRTVASTRRRRASRPRRSSRWCASTRGGARRRSSCCRRACASTRPAGPRRPRWHAAHFGDHEGGRRRLAFDELLLDQPVQLRRARAAPRATGRAARSTSPPTLTQALAATTAAVHADRRPAARRSSAIDADLALDAPDAAPADGRGRLGQDRRRAARDAARRRARAPGGADGPDRDARRAALRDAPGADAGRRRPRGAAHRLDARGAGARDALAKLASGELRSSSARTR